MEIPGGEPRKKGAGRIFEAIKADDFLNWMADIKLYLQESH